MQPPPSPPPRRSETPPLPHSDLTYPPPFPHSNLTYPWHDCPHVESLKIGKRTVRVDLHPERGVTQPSEDAILHATRVVRAAAASTAPHPNPHELIAAIRTVIRCSADAPWQWQSPGRTASSLAVVLVIGDAAFAAPLSSGLGRDNWGVRFPGWTAEYALRMMVSMECFHNLDYREACGDWGDYGFGVESATPPSGVPEPNECERLTFAVLDLQRRRRFRLDPSPDEDDPPYDWVLIEGPRFLPREEWEEMGGCYLALDGSNVDRELLIRRGAPQPGIADLTLYMRRTSSRLGGAR